MSTFRVGVLATPEGILAGRMIAAMLADGVTIDAVLLDPTRLSAREREIHERRTAGRLPPLPLAALEDHRLRCFVVSDHNGAASVSLVRDLGLDLLVNAGTPRICGPALLGAARIGVLNCHPGRLPSYRGACAVEHAVLEDRPVANTVHLMNEGVDEGPILTVEDVPPAGVASYQDLRVATYEAGFRLLGRSVAALQDGRLTAADFVPQGEGRRMGPVDDGTVARVEELVASRRWAPLAEVS